MSTCGTLDSNKQALIKTIAVKRVDLQGNMPTDGASAAVEGRKTAYLYCCFFFVLPHAPSQHTQPLPCQQKVAYAETAREPAGLEAAEAPI